MLSPPSKPKHQIIRGARIWRHRRHRQKFDRFELEIVELVYELACRHVEARDLYRDTANSAEDDHLPKLVFACAASGRLDFDTLSDKVLAQLAEAAPDRPAA